MGTEYHKEELSFLQNNIHPLVQVDVTSVEGINNKDMISFKEPILIGLGDLNPVPIYYDVILESLEEQGIYLIGLDVLLQYDINITTVDGEPTMTILNKSNNSNNSTTNCKKSIIDNNWKLFMFK